MGCSRGKLLVLRMISLCMQHHISMLGIAAAPVLVTLAILGRDDLLSTKSYSTTRALALYLAAACLVPFFMLGKSAAKHVTIDGSDAKSAGLPSSPYERWNLLWIVVQWVAVISILVLTSCALHYLDVDPNLPWTVKAVKLTQAIILVLFTVYSVARTATDQLLNLLALYPATESEKESNPSPPVQNSVASASADVILSAARRLDSAPALGGRATDLIEILHLRRNLPVLQRAADLAVHARQAEEEFGWARAAAASGQASSSASRAGYASAAEEFGTDDNV